MIVPLTELLFTVAQMPRGCVAQKSFHRQFEPVGKVLRAATVARSGLRRVRRRLARQGGTQNGRARDSYVDYLNRGWPGTAVLIDTEAESPQLIEKLADQNSLHEGSDPGPLRPERDRFTHRAAALAAKL